MQKKLLIILFFSFFQTLTLSQNLAPNPDFAIYTSCPNNFSELFALHWSSPPIGTSDYYDTCAVNNIVDVPTNFMGWQHAQSGGAYVGMANYSPIVANTREYVQAQLTSPTVAGTYQLTLVYNFPNLSGFANRLGIYLSNGIPGTYIGQPAQLEVPTIIQDTMNWITETSTFVSSGGETHITIGNFNTDANVSWIPGQPPFGTTVSYTYVDFVEVKLIAPILCDADAGMITTNNNPACPGETITAAVTSYNANPGFDQYILIVDNNNIIIDVFLGDTYNLTYPDCGDFTIYSYNLENSGSGTIPTIGININTINCPIPCCDLESVPVSFQDLVPPNFTSIPENPNFPGGGSFTEIYCIEDISPLPAQYTDNCIMPGSVNPEVTDLSTLCDGGTVVYHWEIQDSCSVPTVHDQTITIAPAPLPIAQNPPPDITVFCDNIPGPSGDLIFWNELNNSCELNETLSPVLFESYNVCGGTAQYVWAGLDMCNRPIQFAQNIIVLPAPVPTYINPPGTVTVSCDQISTIPLMLSYSNGASGVCLIEGEVEAVSSGTIDGCGGQLIYQWEFFDDCGRPVSHLQTINVTAGNPPVLDSIPVDITLDCGVSTFTPDSLLYSNAQSGTCLIVGAIAPDTTMIGNQIFVNWVEQIPCAGNFNVTQVITLQPFPDMSIHQDTAMICTGGSFDLSSINVIDNNNTGASISYHSADPPDATNELSTSIQSPSATTNYFILMTSPGGCSDVAMVTIIPSLLDVAGSGTGSICQGDKFNLFDGLTFVNDLSGTWTDTDASGLNLSDPACVNFTNLGEGSYDFTYVVSTGGNCPPDTAIATIEVLSVPILSITSIQCAVDLNSYDVVVSTDVDVDLSLNYGTLSDLGLGDFQISNIPIMDTLVINAINSVTMCSNDLIVIPPNCNCPFVAPPVSNGDETICFDNLPVVLSVTLDTDQGANWFSESVGGVLLASDVINYTPSISMPGTFIYYVESFDNSNSDCKSNMRTPITVTVIPAPTSTITATDEVCSGDINGSITVQPMIAISTLSTSLNQGPFTNSLIYDILEPGSYSITIMDSLGCSNEYQQTINPGVELSIELLEVLCDNNNTEMDPSDDFYIIDFNVSTTGNENQYNLLIESLDYGAYFYSADNQLTLSADGSNVDFTFVDQNSLCEVNVLNIALIPCSNPCVTFPDATILVDPSNVLDCSVQEVSLSSMEEPNVMYEWSFDNTPISDLTIDGQGQVILLAIDTMTGCQSIDTLDILDLEAYPIINLETDTINCANPIVAIDATQSQSGDQFNYSWYSDGILLQEFTDADIINVEEGGWYILEIIDVDLGCVNSDSIFVEESSMDWSLSITHNVDASGLEVSSTIDPDLIQNISWSPSDNLSCLDCFTPMLLVTESETYTITVTDINGCTAATSITIRQKIKDIYIPNSFSPNGDGLNEHFVLGIPEGVELDNLEMWVFDRWGELLYYKDQLQDADDVDFWDGSFKGQDVNPGVFVFMYAATIKENQRVVSGHGHLTLIR